MHLTNASGQTVSLLNEADQARRGVAAAAAAAAASALSAPTKQWTAKVVSGKARSPVQITSTAAAASRPSLPSLQSLSSAVSAAAALEGRNEELGRRKAAAAKRSSAGVTVADRPQQRHQQRHQSQSQHQIQVQQAAHARSRAVGDDSPPGPGEPLSYHSTYYLHHHNNHQQQHQHLHLHHQAHYSSATTISPSASATNNNISTSPSQRFNAHQHSSIHSQQKPSRPSLNTDSRYFSSNSSSNSLPTVSTFSANQNQASSATISLPYHHTSQQSSSAAAPAPAPAPAAQQHHHHHRQPPPPHSTPTYTHSRNSSSVSTAHPVQPASRPRLTHHEAYSRKSSYSSQLSYASSTTTDPATGYSSQSDLADSPVFSPGAQSLPQLLRFDSASTSSTSRGAQTPSPMTPSFGFDPLDQNKNQNIIDNPYAARSLASNGPYYTTGGMMQQMPSVHQVQQPALNQIPLAQLHAAQLISPASTAPQYNFSSGLTPLALDESTFLPPATVPFPYPGVTADLIPPSPVTNITGSSASPQNLNATPAAQTNVSNNNNSPNQPNNPQQKNKKKYPCPHAQRFGCTDTFTTSGHAARHGKKHTGEKNILCPTCNKAFTRKDNMKQHERTHRNNASTSSAGNRRDSVSGEGSEGAASTSKEGSSTKRSKTAPSAATNGTTAPSHMLTASVPYSPLPLSSTSNFMDADLMEGGPSPAADNELAYGAFGNMDGPKAVRPSNERKISEGGQSMDGEGESPGLDALAAVAEQERR